MSNAETMVMVRERLHEIAHRDSAVSVTVRSEDLRALLGRPAQQPQGEPVALPARKHHVRADYSQDILAEGWNGCLDEIAKLGPLYTHPVQGEPVAFMYTRPEVEWPILSTKKENPGSWLETPLYTHADPSEVERLRVERDTLIRALETADSEVTTLRAQLAEAHALLRRIVKRGKVDYGDLAYGEQLLSASAEPSAPVEIDERAEFEKAGFLMGVEARLLTGREWRIWQARAALERKS